MSLHFEDFTPDTVFASPGRTITETDIVAFAGLSGDFHQIHTNEVYAHSSMFGRRIAHGALILSISIGLTTRMNLLDDTLLVLGGLDRVRFMKPVFAGDTVHVEKRVFEKREMDRERGLVTFLSKVLNQNRETVVIYHDKLLIKRKGQ